MRCGLLKILPLLARRAPEAVQRAITCAVQKSFCGEIRHQHDDPVSAFPSRYQVLGPHEVAFKVEPAGVGRNVYDCGVGGEWEWICSEAFLALTSPRKRPKFTNDEAGDSPQTLPPTTPPINPGARAAGTGNDPQRIPSMLDLFSQRRHPSCDGVTRRDFVKLGALGMSALGLPNLLRARNDARLKGQPTKNTSVVWLWLGGGPTHIETFDPKMSAPAEFRSVTGAIKTNVPGIDLGATFPKMAQCADQMAFVRSFAHSNSGHGGGTHWVMTGYDFPPADNGQGQNQPGLGSIVARFRGPNNSSTGLPTYLRMNEILGDGPSWLGPTFAPFDVSGKARSNMTLQVPMERLSDRRSLLKGFDTVHREIDRSGVMEGLDNFDAQAFDLVLSRARETFDVAKEDPRLRDRYGKGLGEQMLMARRLCEAGVG